MVGKGVSMARTKNRSHRRSQTDAAKLKRAPRAVFSERQRNRLAQDATARFIRSGIDIRDVYGKLDRKLDR
jgi:DNA-nicking Smr family endonuclease